MRMGARASLSYRDSVSRFMVEIQERGRGSAWQELITPPVAAREGPEAPSEEQEAEESAGEGPPGIPESAILTTMEITELDRASAIELLELHGGDVNAVINNIYG